MNVVKFREEEASPPDEQLLLAAIRRGDRGAAERLVETSYGAVFAALVKMCAGDRDLAADLTQDAFRKAWEALPSFDGRARFATWIYRIAYTTFLNHIRRPKKVSALEEQKFEPEDPTPNAGWTVQKREEALRLQRAVMSLNDELRFTVTAHFWGELPVREIAELERITTVAVRKRLDKAYRLLQEALQKDSR